MKLLITFLALTIGIQVTAQIELKGWVKSVENAPIAYAHIGIPGGNVGTASVEDGGFELRIPKAYENDTLKFSAIGFEEKSIPISQLTTFDGLTVTLVEKITALDEVTVSNKKLKQGTIFKTAKSKGGSKVWFGDNGGGTEMFTKVTIPENLHEISQVNLRIGKNTMDTFRIRFSFYEVNSEDLPGKRIVEKSFIVESTVKKGIIKFKLDSVGVWVNKDFFLGFEWIISSKQRAEQLSTVVDWADYGATPDIMSNNTLSVNSGKVIQIRDNDNLLVKEIPLTKSQRKEIQEKFNARKVTYLDMSGRHGSLYKVRSYADYRDLIHSPYIEIIGYKMDD